MDARERLTLFARAVARSRSADEPVTFRAGRAAGVTFTDRLVRFEVDESEREALTGLLGEFPVFKLKQPETRKAPEGTVYVSAVADAKRVADFLDAAFRGPLGCPNGYDVRARHGEREGENGGADGA
jgi:hypothetical protein